MLHLNAYDLQAIHDQFGLPFQKDGPVQYEMQVERLGVLCYRNNLVSPGARFAQIRHHVPERIVPKRVLPLAALDTVSPYVFHILVPRTELLQADEIGKM